MRVSQTKLITFFQSGPQHLRWNKLQYTLNSKVQSITICITTNVKYLYIVRRLKAMYKMIIGFCFNKVL